MKKTFSLVWATALLFLSSPSFSPASESNIDWKEQMLASLTQFEIVFKSRYSFHDWKKEKFEWDVDAEIENARTQINLFDTSKKDFLATYLREYQQIITNLFRSARDYHVGIAFDDTLVYELKFEVRSALEDDTRRYIVVHIDDSLKHHTNASGETKETLNFEIGDEITHFDGRPIDEVVQELKGQLRGNTGETDQTLAERMLTKRRSARGEPSPKNTSTLIKGIKKNPGSSEDQTFSQNLSWGPTKAEFSPSLSDRRSSAEKLFSQEGSATKSAMMVSAETVLNSKDAESDSKHALGGRESFLPPLGLPWVDPTYSLNRPNFKQDKYSEGEQIGAPADEEGTQRASKEDPFNWYITKDRIGYVRIPTYSLNNEIDYRKNVAFFAALIQHMESHTDALVIDQLNNPGGSIFYLYALVSTLSQNGDAIPAPKHRHVMTDGRFKQCKKELANLEKAESFEEKLKAIGEEDASIHGYPIDQNFINFATRYCQFIEAEWERTRQQTDPGAGMLSEPYYVYGVDAINPLQFRGRTTKYSKPIVLLVNELDFSGGDFFPATLQDATRAGIANVTVMGTRTAGAGGYINVNQPGFMEDVGVSLFVVTHSVATRMNESRDKIENLGVTPDVPYTYTVEDLQGGYQPFAEAVKKQVKLLLSKEKSGNPSEDVENTDK